MADYGFLTKRTTVDDLNQDGLYQNQLARQTQAPQFRLGQLNPNAQSMMRDPTYLYNQGKDFTTRAGNMRARMNNIADEQFSMDGWKHDPGYKFQLNQGLKAVNNSYAGRGMSQSGAAMKELNNYAQGQAKQSYGDVYNRNYGQFRDSQNMRYGNAANNYANFTGNVNQAYGNAAQRGQNRMNVALQNYGLQNQNRDYLNSADIDAYNRENSYRDTLFNRYAAISGLGQGATTTMANLGSAGTGSIADYLTQYGNAGASGVIGQANARQAGVNNTIAALGLAAGVGGKVAGRV